MTDIIDFLRARLDERNEVADQIHLALCSYILATEDMPVPEWCDCGQPTFVRADVQAKRRLLDLWQMHDDNGECCDQNQAKALLAVPYADHPDYDPTWTSDV